MLSKEFVERELARAFESWSPYAKLKFEAVDDYHTADIRILFGRYSHGDKLVITLIILIIRPPFPALVTLLTALVLSSPTPTIRTSLVSLVATFTLTRMKTGDPTRLSSGLGWISSLWPSTRSATPSVCPTVRPTTV